MKKALILILRYFTFVFLGLLLGTVFYSLYLTVLNSVAGKSLDFLTWSQLLKPFFFVSACVIILICPLVSYARIRNKGGVVQTVFYIVLCLLTWCIAFPAVIHFGKSYDFNQFSQLTTEKLTGGYFRPQNNQVFYFTRDLDTAPLTNNEIPTVIIDKSQDGKVDVKSLKDYEVYSLYSNAYPFRDSLIRDAFASSSKQINILNFHFYIKRAVKAWNKGWTFYFFGFLSLGLALCSLYALSNITDWRLLNTCFIICGTCLVLFFNTYYYSPIFDSFKRNYVTNNLLFRQLRYYVDDPLLVIINVVFSIILITVGIVRFAVAIKKNKKRG